MPSPSRAPLRPRRSLASVDRRRRSSSVYGPTLSERRAARALDRRPQRQPVSGVQPLEVATVQDDDDDSVPLLRLAGLSGLAGRQRLLHGRALDVDADFREVEVRPECSEQAAEPVATELEPMRLVVPANAF